MSCKENKFRGFPVKLVLIDYGSEEKDSFIQKKKKSQVVPNKSDSNSEPSNLTKLTQSPHAELVKKARIKMGWF